MDLYKLPKDMLVKLVSEIRRDVEKEWREKLEKVETKLNMAVVVGNVNFTHCGTADCENFYAYSDENNDENFAYCEYCDQEYCEEHHEYCESCDSVYCENCYQEKHLIFCDECEEFVCPSVHKFKCEQECEKQIL